MKLDTGHNETEGMGERGEGERRKKERQKERERKRGRDIQYWLIRLEPWS